MVAVKEILEAGTNLSVTIADNASLSSASGTLTKGCAIVGVLLPAAWVAAKVSLQVSVDGGTTYALPVDPATGAYFETQTLTVSNDFHIYVPLDPVMTVGATNVKVQSGTNASTTSQTGGPLTITLVTRPVF